MDPKVQFCYWHYKTVENPAGTDCIAQIDSGRVMECPHKTIEEAEEKCVDYRVGLILIKQNKAGIGIMPVRPGS
jgi:hypothetical protein